MSRDALVVGVNTYQYLPRLQAPARDTEAIAQRLQTYGEFRVHRLPEVVQTGTPQVGLDTPVRLRDLETALVNLFKPKGKTISHTALFYFSGHGIQKDAGIQEGYLSLSDSNPDMGFYGLSLFWLRRLLQESPVQQRIIWLDCCHSGELLNFLEADPGARPGTDRLFMAASREYELAYESLDSPYSVFTQALLTGLDPSRVEGGMVTNHSLTDWVNHSLKGEIQQPLFENSGSEIILTRCTDLPTATKVPAPNDICPYRGLEFFDEDHADYFFGREELTDHLIDKLRIGQFLAVIGASGSGKSSLVRAGLIWELRRGQKFSGSDRWRIKLLTPTEHPLKSLASSFIEPELSDLERAEQLRRAEQFLLDGDAGLAQLVQACLPIEVSTTGLNPPARPRLLLVIDQFEEVFTLCHGPQAEQERQQFFKCLLGAMNASDCLNIVIVLRADFFGKCSLYEGLAQQIEQNLVMVTPLTYEQIKATIVRPAQKVGLICEANLVYTMLLDIIGAPGELPLLQYTLLELWHRRQVDLESGSACLTLDTYMELGGVRGTLQKRATEIFYDLTREEQAIAKRIFLALTQLGEGTEDTRRRVLKSELISPAFPLDLINRTLEKLVAAKLVVMNQDAVGEVEEQRSRGAEGSGETRESWKNAILAADAWLLTPTQTAKLNPQNPSHETIDVAHEALIRNWSLLRNWLEENRESLRRQRWIERTAQEWAIAGHPREADYLLRGGRLMDAEDFLHTCPYELSALAQQYILISQEESHRANRESRLLQIAVPSVLLVALMMTFNQYRNAVITQVEKDYELQMTASRERAAIAQSILEEPNSDPTAALLISRLAAEQGGPTYEAQSSLRAALRALRLQLQLREHQGTINQLLFSPDQRYIATAGSDGKIRIWPLHTQAISVREREPLQILSWHPGDINGASNPQANITQMAISPDGKLVAAIAQGLPHVKVWSAISGEQAFLLELPQAVSQVVFSPDGHWIATVSSDQTVSIWGASTGQLQTRFVPAGATQSIHFSPNGKLLLSVGDNRVAQLWLLHTTQPAKQPLSIKPVLSLQHRTLINSAAFSPSNRLLITACQDGTVRLWDAATGQLHQTLVQTQPQTVRTRSIGQSTAGQSTSVSATVGMMSSVPPEPVSQVLISPNEQLLAVVTTNHQIWLWDLKSRQLRVRLSIPSEPSPEADNKLIPVAFSPDSRLLITASPTPADTDGSYMAHLWNTQTGEQVGELQGHPARLTAARFSPDGTYVATSAKDGVVRLWATNSGGELPSVTSSSAPIRWLSFVQLGRNPAADSSQSMPFSPSQAIAEVVTVAADGRLSQWELGDHPADFSLASEQLDASSASIFLEAQPKGFWRRIFNRLSQTFQTLNPNLSFSRQSAGKQDGVQKEFEIGERIDELPSYPAAIATNTTITATALSQDGRLLAMANQEGWLEIQQHRTEQSLEPLHRFQIFRSSNGITTPTMIRQLAFSPNGYRLLGVGEDCIVRLWDGRSGQLLQTFAGHQSAIQTAQFSFNGQRVITASSDGTARIWDAASGALLRVLTQPNGVSSASFSPDGQEVVTTGWDGTTKVTNAETGLLRVLLTGHKGAVVDAQFSPDGKLIATASADGTTRLWDAETGKEQAQLRPTTDSASVLVRQVLFSPNGQYVAALTEDGRVHLWAVTWETLLKLARDRTLRQLTPAECNHYLHLPPEQCPTLGMRDEG